MKKCFQLIIMLLCIMINPSCFSHREVKKMGFSLNDAIEIANKELSEEGFDVTQKNIIANKNNSLWNKRYLGKQKFKETNAHIVKALENRDYWAVNYTSKEANLFGGSAWVFVDKTSGKIILKFYLK